MDVRPGPDPRLLEALHFLESQLRKSANFQWEIYGIASQDLEFTVKDQDYKTYERALDLGLSLRTFNRGSLGFAWCTHLEPESLRRTVAAARSSMAVHSRDAAHALARKIKRPYPKIPSWDENYLSYSQLDKLNLTKKLEHAARAQDRRISQIEGAKYSEGISHVYLKNSAGLSLEHHDSAFMLELMAISENKKSGETESYGDFTFSPFLQDLDAEQLARQTALKALESLGGRTIASGTYGVILENRASTDLLATLEPALSALAYYKRTSFLNGALDKKIFAKSLNIIDDATLPKRMGSAPFDGEGMPCGQTELIRDGKLVNLLFDSFTSRKMGRPNTAHSNRDNIRNVPHIGSSNLFIAPGKLSLNAMIEEEKKGILVRDFLGLHMSNEHSGDFSFGASGFLIQKGKIAHPIRGFTVSGNLRRLFNQIVHIGNDVDFAGGYGAPSLHLGKHLIGGS